MPVILPGKPEPQLEALHVGQWEGKHYIVYLTGNALVILDGPNDLIQTIYHDSPAPLLAVAFNEASGKIATASGHTITVFEPKAQGFKTYTWSQQADFQLEDKDDEITALSWGISGELLVGSLSLTLFSTGELAGMRWSRRLANKAKLAQFSHDAQLIATSGTYDRLVKLWRRTTIEATDERFDYAYLPHPKAVTNMHWRQPLHPDQAVDHVLFTMCADHKVRVWASYDHHCLSILQLWTEIDLFQALQPRPVPNGGSSQRRMAIILDGRDLTSAVEQVLGGPTPDEKVRQAVDHVVEVANRSPEVCIVLDERGAMSAWGMENIGSKNKKATDVFNITHFEGLPISYAFAQRDYKSNVRLHAFCKAGGDGRLSLLAHDFDGSIGYYEAAIEKLFDLSPRSDRLERKALWTGHSTPMSKINRTLSGRTVISRTHESETIVWQQLTLKGRAALSRRSVLDAKDHVHRMCLLRDGDFAALLHHERIDIWDARRTSAKKVATVEYTIQGKPLCLIVLPEIDPEQRNLHLATISSEMKGIVWEIYLPRQFSARDSVHDVISLEQFCTFDLGTGKDLSFVLPVDPAGSNPGISGFLDVFARDVALAYTHSGTLRTWTAKVDLDAQTVGWLQTASLETGIEDASLVSGSSIRKAAMADKDRHSLTIWDTCSNFMEYQEDCEEDGVIQDLDWASTPDNQSILAVGFPHKVNIYGQLRYNYLDRQQPSWIAIRSISTSALTPHPIGDSVWLASGNLVVGAGNQLFIGEQQVEVSSNLLPQLRDSANERVDRHIFAVVSRLNGSLPIYHPQFVSQCMLAGKFDLARQILLELYNRLKFFTEGDALDIFLGHKVEEFPLDPSAAPRKAQPRLQRRLSFSEKIEEGPTSITEEVAQDLHDKFSHISLPRLSASEQFQLADICDCVSTFEKHSRSIDENASRYLLFWRQHVLSSAKKQSPEPSTLDWREIVWAFHSESQDILVDLTTRHYQGKLRWHQARESGMFMWLTDIEAVRKEFENVARNEYMSTDERNPVDCSLHYLALKKKPVLAGLWRMATWSREQGPTSKLLQHNFNDPRWKTAAQKNAYALMGKRRFHYAAAFFLLADCLGDAVNILTNQVGDIQLAVAVARVYEGDQGPVLRQLLETQILPQAARNGNRWLATWAFWLLGQRDKAVRALVSPLFSLLSPPGSPPNSHNPQTKSYLTADPALAVLYKQLREKSLQTLRGAVMVQPREEWDFVIHTARLYGRMGCDLLALDLVRNWEFLPPVMPSKDTKKTSTTQQNQYFDPTSAPITNGDSVSPLTERFQVDGKDFDPRRLLRRRSSLVVADLPPAIKTSIASKNAGTTVTTAVPDEPDSTTGQGQEKKEKEASKDPEKNPPKPPPPTQFVEPDANSLLDSFGF